MNYKIITDEAKLKEFIDWLPELKRDECYYIALFCRKKYTDKLKSDKLQLKRVTSKKENIFNKIKQMECEIGSYTDKGVSIPEEAMCLYITPNPRSYEKAAKNLAKKLIDLCFNEYNGYNPQAEAMNMIQVACSRTVFMDFDFDHTTIDKMRGEIFNAINPNCVTFVETHGGFHLLIEVDKIEPKYFKTYYNSISKLENSDKRGDGLLPVPGTYQGGFTPRLIKYNIPILPECEECKLEPATTVYSYLNVCETCSNRLNNEFDEEYK